MITLPIALEKFMQGQDLTGLKPFAYLYRNKWDSVNNTYALDTAHPIDISHMILKPNTLSMTLDVNEVAQYNANNVTLSLSDTENRFVEGTPNSYFPAGYQLYGSKVVLYYGINNPQNPYKSQVGYELVGTPTIKNGILINPTNKQNTIKTSQALDVGDNPWEMQFKLLNPTQKGAQLFRINGSNNSRVTLHVNFGMAMFLNYPVSSTGADVRNLSSIWNNAVDNGAKEFYWKISCAGKDANNQYKIKVSCGIELTNLTFQTITIDYPMASGPIEFSSYGSYSTGKPAGYDIDLKETYIKVKDDYFFNGAALFYTPEVTPLFTGVIKDLPTYKPENYQVDLKLVSPLEMLKDIEAKDFSDKVTGETLTYKSTDSDGHRIYWTSGTGVGGFNGVYANGVKLFEGVDYETEQLNELVKPAIVTIINSSHYSATITADYYTWKRDLTVEQIVAGLVGLAGYDSETEDIRKVVWNTSVRNQPLDTGFFAGIGYYESDEHEYSFNWRPTRNSSWSFTTSGYANNKLPDNWDYSFVIQVNNESAPRTNTWGVTIMCLGDTYSATEMPMDDLGNYPNNSYYQLGVMGVKNGLSIRIVSQTIDEGMGTRVKKVLIHKITNSNKTLIGSYDITNTSSTVKSGTLKVTRRGNTVTVYKDGTQVATTTISTSMNYHYQGQYRQGHTGSVKDFWAYSQSWNIYDNNLRLYVGNITRPCFISDICDKTAAGDAWGEISATLTGNGSYFLNAYFSSDLSTWTEPEAYNLNTVLARNERYLYYVLGVSSKPNAGFRINDPTTYYLATTLLLKMVNLSGLTVLEALQDFALISGYEFGVDRNGIFFFRPRVASTNPVYELGHNEVAKVETVKKNLSDFFTKLTLTFAEVPLEFYANTGTRPTAVDKYGIINKDIDKPDIVNYDNPELAQAIGPQLLEVYSAFPDVIQVVGKLNLALELADIVNLKRNYNLVEPENAQEYLKYLTQSTYYRACKITGMNYNFAKRQITYTLRDVSNENNAPVVDAIGFVYELPIELGKIN